MDLIKEFVAIDSALSLHYSSSITTPKLFQICQKASVLAGKRIEPSSVERILGVDDLLFKITSYKGLYDYGITVNVPLTKYGTLLSQRRSAFEKKLAQLEEVKPVKLSDIVVIQSPVKSSSHRSPSTSPTKISKVKLLDLKNDRSKFLFKEKFSALESSKANGLSILERIKLKERMNSQTDPEQLKRDSYESYIRSKLPVVYDIIYELASTFSNGTRAAQSFTLQKVISIIKDSAQYAISNTEIQDIIEDLEKKLGHDRVQLVERNQTKVIKVFNLHREEDLRVLANGSH